MSMTVQYHLQDETGIVASVTRGPLHLPQFGTLSLGEVTFFVAGRGAELGASARVLANRISAELYRMAADADARADVAPQVDVAGDEIPAKIDPAEVPF